MAKATSVDAVATMAAARSMAKRFSCGAVLTQSASADKAAVGIVPGNRPLAMQFLRKMAPKLGAKIARKPKSEAPRQRAHETNRSRNCCRLAGCSHQRRLVDSARIAGSAGARRHPRSASWRTTQRPARAWRRGACAATDDGVCIDIVAQQRRGNAAMASERGFHDGGFRLSRDHLWRRDVAANSRKPLPLRGSPNGSAYPALGDPRNCGWWW